MAEDFQFIPPAPQQSDGMDELYRWVFKAQETINVIQQRMVAEGIGGGGAGGRQVYITDSDDMIAFEAPAAHLYGIEAGTSGNIEHSETGSFWDAFDNQGYKNIDAWTLDEFKTLISLTDCRGVVGPIVGPTHQAAGATVTIEITVDNVKRSRTFTHYHNAGSAGNRRVYTPCPFYNWFETSATAANAALTHWQDREAASEDVNLMFDQTAGEEDLYYTATEQFRLPSLLEMLKMGVPVLSFRRSCLIRMKTNKTPQTSGSLPDYAGAMVLAHRLG